MHLTWARCKDTTIHAKKHRLQVKASTSQLRCAHLSPATMPAGMTLPVRL